MNYNNKLFKVISSSDNGEISSGLIFHYLQNENILFCNYSDKEILSGNIIGVVNNDGTINISYHQVNTKHEISTGMCFSKPERMADGKIKIHESWEWTSGDKSKGYTILEEICEKLE